MPRPGKCADCKKDGMVGGRGLCGLCYNYHHNHHSLDEFPRSTWKNEELLAELNLCRSRGLTVQEAAEKIGVKLRTLQQAIYRAQTRATRAVEPQ